MLLCTNLQKYVPYRTVLSQRKRNYRFPWMSTSYKQGDKIRDEQYLKIRSELCIQIGHRISELRSLLPETQQEFADRMGCSLNYVQRVELGKKALSLLSLVKFSDHLNVQVADLFAKPVGNKPSVGRPKKANSEKP